MPTRARLYIIRHGKAHKQSPTGLDRDRELMDRGEEQADWLGTELAQADPALEVILTSSYARALATAERIAAATSVRLVMSKVLEADQPIEGMLELVLEHADRRCFAIVGHNMQFSDLVDHLVRGDQSPAATELRTGEAAALDLDGLARPGKSKLVRLLRSPVEE